MSSLPLDRQLRQQILFARERVYRFDQPTPLEPLQLPNFVDGPEIWIKREDLSAVKSYKWRGACNRMSVLTEDERQRGVVTASAGNHAQGVAMAAKKLGIRAKVFMPRSTPKIKQKAVLHHGSEWVQIELSGDSYDEAVTAANHFAQEHGATYVHAYDDLHVMAGQGTIADEIVLSGKGPFDAAFLQIGGGGMASGVSAWLKTYWPSIEIIGVEGEDQASMKAALAAKEPIALENLDIFCDGTAVRKTGALPFEICKDTLDRIVTVSNSEVSSAIRSLWEANRCISEPSGAMGLAAALKFSEHYRGKKVLVVISGANIDFAQLGLIANKMGNLPANPSLPVRIQIPEVKGSMLQLLSGPLKGLNISDFQYGKTHPQKAQPAFLLNSDNPSLLDLLPETLRSQGYDFEIVENELDPNFRAIPFRAELLSHPQFLRLDFYERMGALQDFLAQIVKGQANLCYFNYRQSGERIGRALIGLEFETESERQAFCANLPAQGSGYRNCITLSQEAQKHFLGLA